MRLSFLKPPTSAKPRPAPGASLAQLAAGATPVRADRQQRRQRDERLPLHFRRSAEKGDAKDARREGAAPTKKAAPNRAVKTKAKAMPSFGHLRPFEPAPTTAADDNAEFARKASASAGIGTHMAEMNARGRTLSNRKGNVQ